MATSHGVTHKTMHHLAAGSYAGGRYYDRVCLPSVLNPGFWLFLEMLDEPQELYLWTCTGSVA